MSATGKRIRPLPNCRCLQLSGLVRPGSEATPALRVGKDVAISVRSIALLSGEKRASDLPITFRWSLRPIGRTGFISGKVRCEWISFRLNGD